MCRPVRLGAVASDRMTNNGVKPVWERVKFTQRWGAFAFAAGWPLGKWVM